MKIKKIKEMDLTPLAELYVSVFSQPPWRETWRTSSAEDRLCVLLRTPGSYGCCILDVDAQGNRVFLGALIGRALPFKGAMEFEITELFIAPDHEEKELGKMLLEKLHQYLTERGYSKCALLTGRHTLDAPFYEQQGFQTHENCALMSQPLTKKQASADDKALAL